MTEIQKKILIVGPAWVGDMVMAQTLFMRLRQQMPYAQIDVLAPPGMQALLERMPEVNHILSLPFAHGEFAFSARRRLGKSLQAEGYDQALVLPNSWKSALLPFFARIPKRTGWVGEMRYGLLNDTRRLDKKRYPLMIERWMALALPEGAPLPSSYPQPHLEINFANRAKTLAKFGLAQDQPVIALCPGAAFGPAKRWPIEYFSDLANQLLEEGWNVWLFGAKEEAALTLHIQTATQNRCHDLAGSTSLSEAIDLLSCATKVVTNDSGLMHISAALDRPLLALYGSSSPDFTPPLSSRAEILKLQLECQPCFQRTCPLKHFRCMREMTPTFVLQHLKKNHARSDR